MPSNSKEASILLAIQAIHSNPKLNITRASKMYNVPRSTLRDRIAGRLPKTEVRNARHNLTLTEEETLVRYILDLDSQGFPLRIDGVRDMANLLCTTRHAKPVGHHWPYHFV